MVVCALYHGIPFGQMHHRNPRVIEIARLLQRSPGSVAMKLVNFASIDPAQRSRGIRGLQGASRLDEEVWSEFSADFEASGAESEQILLRLQRRAAASAPPCVPQEDGFAFPASTAGTAHEVKIRLAQSFFRKVVLGV